MNPRKQKIIEILENAGVPLSTAKIVQIILASHKVSELTIKRDLSELVAKGYIDRQGQARATKYSLNPSKALVVKINVNHYFSQDLLMNAGMIPLSYRSVKVDEYKKAVLLFYERNNISAFKKIFVEQVQFAVKNYFRSHHS